MKKIVSVSMVKNESDIIESFCRYTLTFCDEMLIYEDNSSDNTLDILIKLINEGLSIVLTSRKAFENIPGYEQSGITNYLMHTAIKFLNADLVLPLDADEFIITVDKSFINPRSILERLDENIEYRFKWLTHIPNNGHYNDNTVFMPKYSSLCEQYTKERYVQHLCKSAVSKKILEAGECMITYGNHAMMNINTQKYNENFLFDSRLFYAHFPIRSVHQAVSKGVILHTNILALNNSLSQSLYRHEKTIFSIFKKTRALSQDDMLEMTQRYMDCSKSIDGRLQLTQASFFENCGITLKYTDYSLIEKNCFYNIMDNFEQTITKLARLAGEHTTN